jgi:2-iminobutanoate/2-iminopropanoate deaminase
MSHHREVITAIGAPAALGPYSHAIRAGGLLFCSGQIPLDPESGELVGDRPADQARQCLENLSVVCAAAGAVLADAVRVTVYLVDMGAFNDVNEVYEGYFEADPPARVAIGVAALPKGAQVEIDAIVALPD